MGGGFSKKSEALRTKELGNTLPARMMNALLERKLEGGDRQRAFIFNSEERAKEAKRQKERAFYVKGIAQPKNAAEGKNRLFLFKTFLDMKTVQ